MLRASLSRRSSQTEKAVSATAFLKATVAYDSGLRVTAARVMTNIRTKPYPLKTNGKAERFIQTALREWAKLTKGSSRRSQLEWSAEGYARAYQRAQDLPYWTHQYNLHRPTRQPNINAAHQPPRSHRGQPVEAERCAAGRYSHSPVV